MVALLDLHSSTRCDSLRRLSHRAGWSRASREGGVGAAVPMNQPDLSEISGVNPVSTPDQTPVQRKSRPYGGIVPSPTDYSSVASLAKRNPANEPEPEGPQTGENIDPTVAKELWERSVTDTSAASNERLGDTRQQDPERRSLVS